MKKLICLSLLCFLLSAVGFSQTPKPSVTKQKATTVESKKQIKKEVLAKAVYTCPMHTEVMKDKPGKCPKCGMNLVKMDDLAKVVYTCPMHSEVMKDKPGKCPKCGMNLVKKEPAKKVTQVM